MRQQMAAMRALDEERQRQMQAQQEQWLLSQRENEMRLAATTSALRESQELAAARAAEASALRAASRRGARPAAVTAAATAATTTPIKILLELVL